MSWLSDAWDSTTGAVSSAVSSTVNAVSDTASAVGRTIEVAAQGAVKGIGTAVGAVGDLAVDVGYNMTTRHAINLFRDEDLETADLNLDSRASEVVTWTEAQTDFERSVMDKAQFAAELTTGALTAGTGLVALAASDDSKSGRSVEVFGQGVVKGVVGGGAAIGDAAVALGYNWTTRHLIGTEAYNPNWAGRAAESVTWTEAQNDYERSLMTAGQVTGEVAGFVAVTVATGGIGGAVAGGSIATVRGTAVGARALSYGTRAASATARAMNPVTGVSRLGLATTSNLAKVGIGAGLAAEAGFGTWRFHDIFTTDAKAAELATQILTENVEAITGGIVNEQTILQNFNSAIQTEMGSIIEKFESAVEDPTKLTDEQRVELLDRVEVLRDGFGLLQELQAGVADDRRQEIIDKLTEVTGISVEEAPVAQAGPLTENTTVVQNVAGSTGEQVTEPINSVVQPATPAPSNNSSTSGQQTEREQQQAEIDRIKALSGSELSNAFNSVVQSEGLEWHSSLNMVVMTLCDLVGLDSLANHFKKAVILDNLSTKFNAAAADTPPAPEKTAELAIVQPEVVRAPALTR